MTGSDPSPGPGTPRDTPETAGEARSGLIDGLRLAVGTLTALPVPPPSTVDRPRARTAMLLAPAVALLPGGLAAAVARLALAAGLDALPAAALVVGTLALATRGLHLDGLADTADGLAASYDRARALEVMRRGDAGPSAVAAVVLVLAVQVTALAQALRGPGATVAVVGVVAGRFALPLACARGVPAARPEGLGAAVAGSVPRLAVAVAGLLTAAGCGGLTAWAAAGTPGEGALRGLGFGVLAVVGAAAVSGLLAGRAVRRFGGVTGDVLGACVEAGTAAGFVVLAALSGWRP